MASNIQQLRSGTSSKRPIPSSLANGQLAVQYHQDDPAIYIKDASGDLVKIAPAFIGSTAPNTNPVVVNAGSFVVGAPIQILTLGDTDFTAIGASATPAVGEVFTPTGAGSGTGTASSFQGNAVGEVWLNTQTSPPKLQIYNGSAWLDAGGAGAVGAGGDQIFLEVDQSLSASYSITAGKNALTAGPLEIESGQTLTIPSGSNLVIV
tara:strand:+ start:51 stop:671 length:621 start_codon:yes stop_codon:yes gene_type:complete